MDSDLVIGTQRRPAGASESESLARCSTMGDPLLSIGTGTAQPWMPLTGTVTDSERYSPSLALAVGKDLGRCGLRLELQASAVWPGAEEPCPLRPVWRRLTARLTPGPEGLRLIQALSL